MNVTSLHTLFRPMQYDMLNYQRGLVGVSAVPGSGKTFTLSHLAANLVRGLSDKADQPEVLIVTFANAAVNSFKKRIADILQRERGMLPYVGYRVRTLHGLAHDILRERPALAGLADDFRIVDERVAAAIQRDVVEKWLHENLESAAWLTDYLSSDVQNDPKKLKRVREYELSETAVRMADAFIRRAKDLDLSPEALREQLDGAMQDLPLARFGVEIYELYRRSLSNRGAVDFDDLVRLAIGALRTDAKYRKRLQKRWPFILEDEAQDSSLLQEQMLRLLSDGKNWVRVGDPNQSINTTFSTANPEFLRSFLTQPGVKALTLAEAGRSAGPILDLANYLVDWAATQHPVEALRSAFYTQRIELTPPGDRQGNPPAESAHIHIQYKPGLNISPEKELELVVSSLARWLPDHPGETVAVLVPENSRGFKLAEALRARELPYEELLRSTTATRTAAEALRSVLAYLSTPNDYVALSRLYRDIWWPPHLGRTDEQEALRGEVTKALANFHNVESFLWPTSESDSLSTLNLAEPEAAQELRADLDAFRALMRRWLEATILPIDQLILTINQDLFTSPVDIALGYKLASLLRSASHHNPGWRLPEFVEELRAISQNERKFLGFDDAEAGYEPKPGKVTIATMHAAKGLEWDRVYLMAVSNYAFPSAQAYDTYLSERWFVRDRLNLEAEALAQLNALRGERSYAEGDATRRARLDYAAERLRLLYVGITRARRELIITWNAGKFSQTTGITNQPSIPLLALWEFQNAREAAKTAFAEEPKAT